MNSIFAKRLYTGEKVLEDSYVSFKGSLITAVGTKPSGEVVGRYEVITPALIDPHSHIGMVRSAYPADESEANEQMESMMVLPDALDSVQMDDPAFIDSIEMGVLYSCVLPGSGNIIGGLSAVIRHYAPDSSSALIARAGVKCAFGHNPRSVRNWKGARPSTRMGVMAMIKSRFYEVQAKLDNQSRSDRGARPKGKSELTAADKVIADILTGKIHLRCHVHKDDDIASLLRLADEFGFKFTVEHAKGAVLESTFRELADRKIDLVYGPMDAFARKTELWEANWRNVALPIEAGLDPAIMTDHPVTPSRQLLHTARWLCRCGYSDQQAIEALTRRNAEVLGVSDKIGVLKRRRWASFVCWSGDPFDIRSYPNAVFGEGELIFGSE